MYLNKKHERRRTELGKSGQLQDESMIPKDKLVESKEVELEGYINSRQVAVDQDNGLQDMTDIQNEDFIYTY